MELLHRPMDFGYGNLSKEDSRLYEQVKNGEEPHQRAIKRMLEDKSESPICKPKK